MSIGSTGMSGVMPRQATNTTTSKQDDKFYPVEDYIQEKKTGSNSLVDTSNLRKPTAELGQDAFLQILIAQLANQDPMEPMKDTDFIAQMAQFSALEQMQALNQSFINSQAYSMVGKTVVATTNIQGADGEYVQTTLTGVVSGIETVNGKPYLIVGDYLLEPASVSQVYESNQLGDSIIQGGLLVGKYVSANKVDENGKVTEITGKITKIIAKEGRVYAVIDGKEEVPVSYITAIADEPITGSGGSEGDKTEGDNNGEGGNSAGGEAATDKAEQA